VSPVPRTPPPPAAIVEWMERFGWTSDMSEVGPLRDAALRALAEALARPGRDRDGAFALLAADGLLTWAMEDAADAADPDAELMELLRVVRDVSGGEAG